MENKEHYFYVLSCKDGSLYAGYTNDLQRRIRLHNEGKGAKYTRGRGRRLFSQNPILRLKVKRSRRNMHLNS